MSAPAAPLTPADITALLGDGWTYEASEGENPIHTWSTGYLGSSVRIVDGDLTVRHDGGYWRVPATPLDARYALTRAGLIPGKVSVTQPRDDDYEHRTIDHYEGLSKRAEKLVGCIETLIAAHRRGSFAAEGTLAEVQRAINEHGIDCGRAWAAYMDIASDVPEVVDR